MFEETKSKDRKVVKLTNQQYRELERAMQWPEDLAAWDKLDSPINLTELVI